MAETLKHQPFAQPLMALNADKKPKSNVTRLHPTVVVRRPFARDTAQPRQAPLPGMEPPAEVAEPVAAKKRPGQKGYKRSPESIAKQKATYAAKKAARAADGNGARKSKRVGKKRGPYRKLADTQIAAALEESPLDIVLDMLAMADRARQALGNGSRKRLLSELTKRLG